MKSLQESVWINLFKHRYFKSKGNENGEAEENQIWTMMRTFSFTLSGVRVRRR